MIYALILAVALPWNRPSNDFTVICSVAVAVANAEGPATPQPQPPRPTPATDKCDACDGTGENGDGANARTCWKCKGSGKETEPNPTETGKRLLPRVQCVIYSDSPRCAPCRQLISRLRSRLVDDVKARGERPWAVGENESDHFRVVEMQSNQAEFDKRNITTIPTVVFVVDGDEIPTSERDPVKLANRYLELMR